MKIAYIPLPWLSCLWNNRLVSGIIVLFWDKQHTTVLPVASVGAVPICGRPGDLLDPKRSEPCGRRIGPRHSFAACSSSITDNSLLPANDCRSSALEGDGSRPLPRQVTRSFFPSAAGRVKPLCLFAEIVS